MTVIHCKDCRFFIQATWNDDSAITMNVCALNGDGFGPDDFCSKAEKVSIVLEKPNCDDCQKSSDPSMYLFVDPAFQGNNECLANNSKNYWTVDSCNWYQGKIEV